MKNRNKILLFIFSAFLMRCHPAPSRLFEIGKADGSADEFALAPNGFADFVQRDFGYEDRFFLVNYSKEKENFPYALPGPVDLWGGTFPWAGWRFNQVNILFKLEEKKADGDFTLVVKLSDYAKKFLPLMKVTVNDKLQMKKQLTAEGRDVKTQPLPTLREKTVDSAALVSQAADATPTTLEFQIPNDILRKGGNKIMLTVIEGSWIKFDAVYLQGEGKAAKEHGNFFVENASAADYQTEEGQPLLVNVYHLNGNSQCRAELDGKTILNEPIDKGQYEFEAPMPVTANPTKSVYKIYDGDKAIEEGEVMRSPQPKQTLADYVDTRIGASHSRWMIAPGPWMPFSMAKISPDNQNEGWQSGYQPNFESIGTFSHIHEWTLAGLGTFPTTGKLKTKIGNELSADEGYRSAIDKTSETAKIGYYKVLLTDYNIKAELTATARCSFQRYTFPSSADSGRVMVDLQVPNEYPYQLKEIHLKKVNSNTIEGYAHQLAPKVWSDDADQDYTVYFTIDFDAPIQKMGTWVNDAVEYNNEVTAKDVKRAGAFLIFDAKQKPTVQLRTGISLVSIANARMNLDHEITHTFAWDFDAVRNNQVKAWNDIFDRVTITANDRREKMRFYNSVYRSYCSRNIWSDVNGDWRGTDGRTLRLKNKDDVALGCDAFWNTFWNLNQVWNLLTPEWSRRWVNSELAMFDAYGWLSKGPAGMNYIPVMVAEHEIPLMTSAVQMGVKNLDVDKILKAALKMQTTPSQKVFAGYAGNRDLVPYLQYKYVPSDKGRFSNTMEYSYDDWAVGQLAKKMGNEEVYKKYNERGYWWKNALDAEGFCHLRLANGEWTKDFDPMLTGANDEYVEANGWQMSFFVPQDVRELVKTVGKEKFAERLNHGFEISEPWRYNGLHDQYWNCPVSHGNQQSMQFAFLFNYADMPWLTQKWSRSIIDRYYGYGEGNAYLGDEDQGQMSGWLVMAALGLFQTDGGCNAQPTYEIASPLYPKTVINLGERDGRGKTFAIIAKNASRANRYVQSALLNGKELQSFSFPASELLKGGELVLEMGKNPNKSWGIEK